MAKSTKSQKAAQKRLDKIVQSITLKTEFENFYTFTDNRINYKEDGQNEPYITISSLSHDGLFHIPVSDIPLFISILETFLP
jgi:hypothetical protein